MLTFLILALATYRITHLLVYDKVFEPIRNFFVIRIFVAKTTGPCIYFELQGCRLRRFVGMILNCPWCAGVWVSTGVILLNQLGPSWLYFIWVIAAAAAMQSLLETAWIKAVGYPEMTPLERES